MKIENNKTTNIILILLVLIFLVVLSNASSNSVSSQAPSDDSQTVNIYILRGKKKTGFLNYKVFLRLRLLKILSKQLNGKLTIKII